MKNWMRNVGVGVLLLSAAQGRGQNLVPNGSFEDFITCPQTVGAWQQVVGWDSPFTTSADYFNACAPPNPAGVPYNLVAYQYAADGQAYMGVVTCDPNTTYRELLHAELQQPLQAGVPVHLCFRVAVGGFGLTPINSAMLTCKGVGLRFFNTMPADFLEWDTYFQNPPNSAALYLDVVPTDTAIWYAVSGTYIPDSSYTDVVIGNFFDAANSDVQILDSTGYGVFPFSYALIDDVVVSYDPLECSSVGVNDEPRTFHLTVAPNPFWDEILIDFGGANDEVLSVSVTDAVGRKVITEHRHQGAGSMVLETRNLASGLYYLVIMGSEERILGTHTLLHATP